MEPTTNSKSPIIQCLDYEDICLAALQRYVSSHPEGVELERVGLIQDCYEICKNHTYTQYNVEICKLCAEICVACTDIEKLMESHDIVQKAMRLQQLIKNVKEDGPL